MRILLALILVCACLPGCMSTGLPIEKAEPVQVKSLLPKLIAVSVSDAAATRDWYVRILGFQAGETYAFEDSGMRVYFVEKDGFEIEIIEKPATPDFDAPVPADPATRQGYVKLAFATEDINALYEKVRQAGADVLNELRPSRRTGGQFFILRDPDGHWVQIFSRPDQES